MRYPKAVPIRSDGLLQQTPSGPAYCELELNEHAVGIIRDDPDDFTELPWEDVTGWRVDPSHYDGVDGACVGIATLDETRYLHLPQVDPEQISSEIARLSNANSRSETGEPPVPEPQDTTDVVAPRWKRFEKVCVVVLVIVIATGVTLILAQSAGTIHLSFLGSSGSQGR